MFGPPPVPSSREEQPVSVNNQKGCEIRTKDSFLLLLCMCVKSTSINDNVEVSHPPHPTSPNVFLLHLTPPITLLVAPRNQNSAAELKLDTRVESWFILRAHWCVCVCAWIIDAHMWPSEQLFVVRPPPHAAFLHNDDSSHPPHREYRPVLTF